MTVAPRAALRDFGPFEIDVAGAEVVLDHLGDGTALDEGGEDFHREAEVGGDAGDVGLGAGDLHDEGAGGVDGRAVGWSDADSHAGGDEEGVFAVLFQFDLHVWHRCLKQFGAGKTIEKRKRELVIRGWGITQRAQREEGVGEKIGARERT